jgi:opacity protein-like surface antigen
MKKVLVLLTAVFLFVAMTSNAQEIDKFAKKGQWELGGSIGFTSSTPVVDGNTGDASSVITFAPSASYFVAPGFEVGLLVQLTSTKYSGIDAMTDYTLYLAPAYNFKTHSMFYPYIQGQIGYTGFSMSGSSTKGLAWAVEGGVKANLVPHVLLKLGINYSQLTRKPEGASNRYGTNNINAMVGFGVFF